MGEHAVSSDTGHDERRAFMRALLEDVHALERMLRDGAFESGVRRIGAEQEMFLVDGSLRPAPVATEVLAAAADPRLTTELALFNLEANLSPRVFGGACLREMEAEILEVLEKAGDAAAARGASILLAGILPTLRQGDLGLANMTPNPRYAELNRAITRLRGGDFHVRIKGVDELETTHDNVMLESCNTSFQIHFQVGAEEFPRLYNLAQLVAAPVLAAAVNSPVLLGHRLWCETRVALFQHSLDTRGARRHRLRADRPRVSFGDAWVRDSVLEIFREDIARFRAILAMPVEEAALAALEAGRVPALTALRLHNGTVYRWNRACYGISGGKPHLRIENRVLPAGPTVQDEIANAAFFFGLMASLADTLPDVAGAMDFDDAKANFFAAARHGLGAQFRWPGAEGARAADRLILDDLLPRAREGLRGHGVDGTDVDRFTGILEERVRSGRTGARWAQGSLAAMGNAGTADVRHRALTATMLSRQRSGEPVHRWRPAALEEARDWRDSYRTVNQFMTTDLLTVRPDDLVDLAASMMDWERLRYVPVEDDDGRLVGIVSHRAVLRLVARGLGKGGAAPALVRDIMKTDPVTVPPDMDTRGALRTMRDRVVGCLPVVEDGRLVGMVTEQNLVDVAARLLEDALKDG